jgi:hypothetical protein
MITTGWDLETAIRDLIALDDQRQLSHLQQAWAAECRGQPRDGARLVSANQVLRVRAVSAGLAALFDLPPGPCEVAVRSMLLPHPRREAALKLIDQFLGHAATLDKLERERAKGKVG